MTNFPGEFFYHDLFATKGMEYLIVIGFLAALIGFWRWATRPAYVESPVYHGLGISGWFHFPSDIFYHRGHTWAKVENGTVKVGIDDFAQKLIGRPETMEVPKVGERVDQGDVALRFKVDSKIVKMLSPVEGEVVEINESVLKDPEILTKDPYGEGWLFKVKSEDSKKSLRNLLDGILARVWIEDSVERLRDRMGSKLGYVLQDGGVPVSGMARVIDEANWDRLLNEFFLIEE